MDSLGWTKHWLNRRRCDLLTVFLATNPKVRPRMRIIAVESKSKTGDIPITLNPKIPPFDEGIEQVVETLDALRDMLVVDTSNTIISDLKLSTLFEHLTSEVLAQISPINSNERFKLEILNVLSEFSNRKLKMNDDLLLNGLVVVTQRDANVKTEIQEIKELYKEHAWPIKLVRCGIPALGKIFKDYGLVSIPITTQDESEALEKQSLDKKMEQNGEIPEKSTYKPGSDTKHLSPDTLELINQLETACQLRRFPIDPIDPKISQEGPTLIIVPAVFQAGEKLAPILAARYDLARELGVSNVVIENDPTRAYYIRFLLPRIDRQFPNLPVKQPSADQDQYLALWLGSEVDGTPFKSHISEWPHLLVAGTTGSGKTTFLRSILLQADKLDKDIKVIIIDGKGEYDYIDLLQTERFLNEFPNVLLGHIHVIPVLKWLVGSEIAKRRNILKDYFKKNPKAPRASRQAYVDSKKSSKHFPVSPLLIVVDEFAEIMLASGSAAKEFEDLVQRVVQAGRSALVHLVLATQRPDANVLRGAIKANLPSRVALSLPSHHDSMTVLNSSGAEDLLGKGDFIFQSNTINRIRLQGFMPPL